MLSSEVLIADIFWNNSTLLLNIQQDMRSLVTIQPEQNILCILKPTDPTKSASFDKKTKLVPIEPESLTLPSHIDDINEIANCLKDRAIIQRMYPLAHAAAESIRMKPHQLLYIKPYISISVGSGAIASRDKFSHDRTKATFKGYTGLVTFQDTGWMFRRLVLQLRYYYSLPHLPDSDIRLRLQFPRVIIPNSPWYRAAQNGDVPALGQWLQSRKVSISDVTVHGDTLLHVSTV